MKKFIAVLLAITALFTFVSCAGGVSEKEPETNNAPTVSPKDVMGEVTAKAEKLCEHTVFDSETNPLAEGQINYYYSDLEEGEFSDLVESYAVLVSTGENFCEAGVFKLKDNANKEKLLSALNFRKTVTEEMHKNYVPENYNRAQNAVIGEKLGYVYYLMTDENAVLEETIINSVTNSAK